MTRTVKPAVQTLTAICLKAPHKQMARFIPWSQHRFLYCLYSVPPTVHQLQMCWQSVACAASCRDGAFRRDQVNSSHLHTRSLQTRLAPTHVTCQSLDEMDRRQLRLWATFWSSWCVSRLWLRVLVNFMLSWGWGWNSHWLKQGLYFKKLVANFSQKCY